MKTYTEQETFDKVARHLLTQSKRSVVFSELEAQDECAYQTPLGLKCAVGCLIPDDGYCPEFEGHNAVGLSRILDTPGFVFGHDVRLCKRLQEVHDLLRVHAWKGCLIEVGLDHSLDVTVCNEFDWDEGTECYVLKKSA